MWYWGLKNVNSAIEKISILFHLIVINYSFDLNSHMCLVVTALDSEGLLYAR
jgi:hypothetical protein